MVRRRGLATFLKAFDDLELAGETASGDAATQPPALGHDLTERERAVLAVRHGLSA